MNIIFVWICWRGFHDGSVVFMIRWLFLDHSWVKPVSNHLICHIICNINIRVSCEILMNRFKTPKKMCHMPIVILIGCSSTVESWKRILFSSIPIQPILFILVSQVYVYFSTVGGSSFWHHAKFDDAKNQGSYTTSEFLGLRHPEGRYGQVMIII